MEGPHDLGGYGDFGPVVVPDGELGHHEPFELRVQGMAVSTIKGTMRPYIERLDPGVYFSSSYYERWLAGLELAVTERRLISHDDLLRWRVALHADPDLGVPTASDPERTARVDALMTTPELLAPATSPRFAVGERVRVRRLLGVHTHHRCPRFVRGVTGRVESVCGQARVAGRRGEWAALYTVAFAAEDLWGADAEAGHVVMVDLNEVYLEPGGEP